jgi:hypothetical protein
MHPWSIPESYKGIALAELKRHFAARFIFDP